MIVDLLEMKAVVYGAKVSALNGPDVGPSKDSFRYTLNCTPAVGHKRFG